MILSTTGQTVAVPVPLAEAYRCEFGDYGRAWVAALPTLADDCLKRWRLRLDGPATHGAVALVLPVRRADDAPAVLKLQPVDEETCGEPIALRAWDGDGAVRLLEHDPGSGAMLLESLDAQRPLSSLAETAAVEILSHLLARLSARPAPAGLRRLGDVAARLLQ
ncbi:MAG: aminoglycoside phosphotransferase family protein, partial [Stackebrandtia sp.]